VAGGWASPEKIKGLAALGVWVVVVQLGKLNFTSPVGKLMLAMLAAVTEMERDLIVERTQAGLGRAKAEGKALGRPAKTTPEQRKAMTQGLREQAERQRLGEALRRLTRDRADNRETTDRIRLLLERSDQW
jgi:putative DNA-invertase from lambdoid prophage Rac